MKAQVKLEVVEGYGTRANPYIGGTQRVIEVSEELGENEHIRAIHLFSYSEPDENGRQEAGGDTIPVIPYEFINSLIGMLMGIEDASFSDETQRNAHKDLVKQKVWQWYESQGHTSLV